MTDTNEMEVQIKTSDTTMTDDNQTQNSTVRKIWQKKRVVTAGKSDRKWIVEPVDWEGEIVDCLVHYTDKDKQAKEVAIEKDGLFRTCNGTHFQHRNSCPHVKASEKVVEKCIELEKSAKKSTAEIDETTPVHIDGGIEYYGGRL